MEVVNGIAFGYREIISVVVKLEGGTEDDVAALKSEKIDDESVLELKKLRRRVFACTKRYKI